ncbi:MAG: DNA polymerase III subunit gamma/tau [Lachnospiraceae bacterium]|nr:DNA polymerase III subunit gamma/tau [Lachnospiraceae bacterium]
MYKSLATKYRPKNFNEVVEQDVTVKILQKVIEKGTPKNAYLFAGESGDGKTTLARIFANKLNNGEGDPIEIDAASNNGVDQVRAILEAANQRALTGTYKVFIIDEAHAITSAGWQAFLKGIEEPPMYTIFMFCTTEPHKIPATILNRLQRYNITKISNEGIRGRLEYICQQEGFINYTDTCDLISKISQGCMRDAITLLDQCADFSTDLNLENTKQVLGNVTAEVMMKLTNFLVDGNEAKVFAVIETLANQGIDLKQFISNYLDFVLDLCKYILFGTIGVTSIPQYLEETEDQALNIKYTTGFENNLLWFNKLSDRLLEIKSAIKYDTSIKSTIEAYLLKTCRGI